MSAESTTTLLTPSGSGAIAVVRIAGAGVGAFLQRHFLRRPAPDRAVHGELRDGERVIDDPVVVLHEGGEVADVNLHGGAWVVMTFLELVEREGFEIVESVEGVLPDIVVDSVNAIERTMLAHLPLAKTEAALRMLLAQPALWREFDVNATSKELLARMVADASLWWMLHPPRVAIVGTPNVGKSTLANQLFAQERSITADVPGTTRDWVGEIANLDGLAVMLVDTPGVRATNDAIEAEAIERSREVVRGADAIVIVLDASAENEMEQIAMMERYPPAYPSLGGTHLPAVLNEWLHGLAARATSFQKKADAIRVLNKSDRARPWSRNISSAIATTATTGEGIDALRHTIRSKFDCETFDVDYPRWWTQSQRDALLERSNQA